MSRESAGAILPMGRSEKNSSDSNNVPSLRKDICEHISTVLHTLTFVLAAFLISLCFKRDIVLFIWHPFLYTIGWVCLMMEAILVVSPDNLFSKRLSFKLRVRCHWLIQILAVGCSTGGFFIDFIRKSQRNSPHFQSMHGLIGLIAMACLIPTCLNGLAALFNIELKKYIKPSINKLIHAICGTITFIMGSAAMILSFDTGWFRSRTGEAAELLRVICITIVAFGTVWCLVRPLFTSFNRVKSIVS